MCKNTRLLRSVSVFLAVLMTVSIITLFSSENVLAAVGDSENIVSDKTAVFKAYDQIDSEDKSAYAFTNGVPIGIRMGFGAPFRRISVCLPTWGDVVSLTISIYKWDHDLETSRKSTPLVTKSFENHRDNNHANMTFNELPAGEYLICVDEFSGGRLGIWQMRDNKVGKGYTYENGIESAVDWMISVTFTKTPKEAFFPVQSIENTNYGDHTAPAEQIPADDALVNTHKVMPDTWVFTDGLGRESLTYEDVGAVKEDKNVSMFYWIWHVDLAESEPLNINEFTEKYPDSVNDYDHPEWPKDGTAYFWNEPIYGYYRTNDKWVLRRQAELLANAGVDTIFTDNTNSNFTWRSGYIPLYETWSDALENGAVNVPKVSFLLPFAATPESADQLKRLYLDIYAQGKFQNLWYYWEDRPMIMAHKVVSDDKTELQKEIDNYFTYRPGYAGYANGATENHLGSWGWLSVTPQAAYYADGRNMQKKQVEQTTVGVSMNYDYVLNSLAPMNGKNIMGRSYSTINQDRYAKEGNEASKYGYNFAEQWDNAISMDPKMIFVTGWNEWTAGRHEEWADIENGFPDQFNDEFSRDIEPTKGELKDHYYYQLVNYIRKYKGCNPIPTPSNAKIIDLNAGAEQWSDVLPYYAAYIGNTEDRDAQGYGSLTYTETSGRNDIVGAQIARDGEYVYFHVECAENITPYTDKLWMNLYIDSDQSKQGWNTFEYVLNKSAASAETLVLEKFTEDNDYSKTEKVADVEYKVDGKTMTVKIAKSALGLSGNDYTINFSWTDNVHDEGNYDAYSGDIMDFYISGDVAPGGRFKYSYISTTENSGTVPEPSVGGDPADPQKPSSLKTVALVSGAAVVVIAAVVVAVVIVRKRKS